MSIADTHGSAIFDCAPLNAGFCADGAFAINVGLGSGRADDVGYEPKA